MVVAGPLGPVVAVAVAEGLVDLRAEEPDLEDAFLGLYRAESGDA